MSPAERGAEEHTSLEERMRVEQRAILSFDPPPATNRALTILGITAWPSLWSMGAGAGMMAFARSLVAPAAVGHRVHLVLPRGDGRDGDDECAGVRFHRYRTPSAFSDPRRALPVRLISRGWRYACYQACAPVAALRVARRMTPAPDVVVAYGVMSLPAAARVAARLNRPLVARCFGNHLSAALHKRLRWYGNFIERIGFRVPCGAMILTNDGSRILEALARLGVDWAPIHYLRNGIEEGLFTPGPRPAALVRRLGLSADAFVLAGVTRLHAEKRLARAVRALAGLRPLVPQAALVLVGDGPERGALQALARRLGVADAVRFAGAVPHVELPQWYRLADVVLSLLDRTNASNPVFEAMACERCVVALDAGNTREVIQDGVNGVVVPPAREGELPLILAHLARHAEERAALGRRARPTVLELCGTVRARLLHEVAIVEAVARDGHARGNLSTGGGAIPVPRRVLQG